ncbi:MAG: tetratricopeptide repeat protein [Bacteroidales bacterium]|nr:tetratricopeptide repeat protein [Bacteroidales bacterium]
MHTDDEEDDLEFDALLERFAQAADEDFEGFYMDSEDLFDVISYYIDLFNIEKVQQGFDVAFRLFPDDPVFQLLHAKFSALQGYYPEADQELQQIKQLHPNVPEAYVEEVILAQLTHKEVDTFQLLDKAISLNYELPEAHALLALEFLKKKDVNAALSHIQTAISQDKQTLANMEILIFPNFKSFDGEKLVELLTALTDEYPMQEDTWHMLGMAYYCLNRTKEALNAFQFQYSLNPDNQHILFNLADCYYRMGDYDNALQQYVEFQHANLYPVDILIGKCYYRMKKYDKALQIFIDADQNDPLYIFKFEEIVKVCRAMDNIPMAQNLLRKYFAEENQSTVIATLAPRLLMLLEPDKDHDEILDILERLFTEDNSEYNFFRLILQLIYYYDTPEAFDLGIDIMNKFQESVINDTYIQYCLGIFYLEKEWNAKGRDHIERAFGAMTQSEFEDFYYMSAKPYDLIPLREIAQEFNLEIPDDPEGVVNLFDDSDDAADEYFFDFTFD